MNNDRFKFSTPYYFGDKFAGFQYWEFEHGRVKLIGNYWKPWVSKRDKLTAKPDEQCTGLKDKKGYLIFEGDILEAGRRRYVVCWAHHCFVMRSTPGSATSYPLCGTDLFEIVGNVHDSSNDNVGETK